MVSREYIKARQSPTRPAGLWTFINWALWGNADDGPYGDEKFRAGRKPSFRLAVLWWCRNPAHNLCFYVLGYADQPHFFCGSKNWGVDPGWSLHYVEQLGGSGRRYLISYVGKKRGFYIGWRPAAAFGVSFNFAKH